MTQLGSLDEAATYIKKLKERVEELRQKRNSARLLAAAGRGGSASTSTSAATTTASGGAGSSEDEAGHREDMPAVVEVRQHSDGSSLDVVLISSVERPFKLHEVVTVPPCWRKKAPRPSTPTSPSPAPKSSTPSTAGYVDWRSTLQFSNLFVSKSFNLMSDIFKTTLITWWVY